MKFSSFSFFLTEDCNFNCSYCYQKKGKKHIDIATVKKAINFFLPYLTERCYVNFTGGEPLLDFEHISEAVTYIQNKDKNLKKQIQYSITTNGSLVDDKILHFLKQNKFSLMLSFDAFAQDISRKEGSFNQIVSLIRKLQSKPDIDFEINSVFTPETIKYLSRSIKFIFELDVQNVELSFSCIHPWNSSSLFQLKKELESLRKFTLSFYRKSASIPLVNFRRNSGKGIFACFSGWDRMALSPDGKLWGCYLFADYFKGKEKTSEYYKYCFGGIDSFIEKHEIVYPEILSNYSKLSMNYFYTPTVPCRSCEDFDDCSVCPVNAAFSSSIIGEIPIWICQIRKILRKEKKIFREEIENYG